MIEGLNKKDQVIVRSSNELYYNKESKQLEKKDME